MKTFLRQFSSVMMIALIISAGFACKKKSEDTAKQFRVTQSLYYYDNDSTPDYKNTFEYLNDKISMIRGYTFNTQTNQFIENNRSQFEYPDANTIIMTASFLVTDAKAWEPDYKIEATLTNGKVAESKAYTYYNPTWVPEYKFNCTYSSQNMTSLISYEYSSGIWQNDWKQENTYSGSKITQSISYEFSSTWVQDWKDVITYNGDQFDNVTGYNYDGYTFVPSSKYVYEYSNSLISRITESYYYSGNWSVTGTSLYTYDSNKNLTVENHNSYYSNRTEYTYAEGKGNWSQVTDIFDDDSYIWNRLFPHPTKGKEGKPVKRFLPKPEGAM